MLRTIVGPIIVMTLIAIFCKRVEEKPSLWDFVDEELSPDDD